MPENTAAQTAAPGPDTKSARLVNPDRVGEELADDANIWHVYDRVAKEDDERRTKAWDTGLNNLALFAGLFSAVTTAFIIEARKDMVPDYAQLTFFVLNATAFGEKPVHQAFVVPSSARTVNCFWLASLILSLSAALIAIMGKDWIGMYTARPICNLRQWAEMRTYRLLCVDRWYMSGVIAAAPVLLHVSLLLFVAGLALFISSDQFTHHLTLGLSLAAGILYLVTTLSAVAFSASPFKSPATQMIRTAVSALYSYLCSIVCSIIYPPKRTPVRTLVSKILATVLGRADGSPFLPGGPAESGHLYSGLLPAIIKAPIAAIALAWNIPTWVCTVRDNLQWSVVQPHLQSIVSAARHCSFDWFLSSKWTDLPTDRRPKLLAEALSWLSLGSQAPDVFRAIVFALGDLDIGPDVAKHASPALRTRLRTVIRHTWRQVDFLTLSRFVLADRNSPGDPVLSYGQFVSCFDLFTDSALRCEDGLAAAIIINPRLIQPHHIIKCCPYQVSQPRMLGFLLPRLPKQHIYLADILILLSHRYRMHLWTTNSFNLAALEAHLYRTLDIETRNGYNGVVAVEYGGTAGVIELLTFLCCYVVQDFTKPAAVDRLLMLFLGRLPLGRHRCLAFLLGTRALWGIAWRKKWSLPLLDLTESLAFFCLHPVEPSSVRTLLDDWHFDNALARTAVMVLSPQQKWTLGPEPRWMEFLCGYLCAPPPPSLAGNTRQLEVIRLILEGAGLCTIVCIPFPDDDSIFKDTVASYGISILAAIIRAVGRCLRYPRPGTFRGAVRLLEDLALTQVESLEGDCTSIWDLGSWLCTQAPQILGLCPSSTTKMQDVHDAVCDLYPLCQRNHKLRAIWDRIGYPGRPGDTFSDPYLNIGEFFANAEHAV